MTTMTQTFVSALAPHANGADEGMAALEAAALDKNEMDFLAARQAICWEKRPPEDFVRAVDLAFMAGAFLAARNLATEGAAQYPDHAELQKMAYVLAPPIVTVGKAATNQTWKANREWLKTHWHEYRGQWVAIHDGRLLGVADDLDALVQQVGEIKGTDILVTPIW